MYFSYVNMFKDIVDSCMIKVTGTYKSITLTSLKSEQVVSFSSSALISSGRIIPTYIDYYCNIFHHFSQFLQLSQSVVEKPNKKVHV